MQRKLDFVPRKNLILLATGAVGALQATNKQHRNTQRYQDGQNAREGGNPVKKVMHKCGRGTRTGPIFKVKQSCC